MACHSWGSEFPEAYPRVKGLPTLFHIPQAAVKRPKAAFIEEALGEANWVCSFKEIWKPQDGRLGANPVRLSGSDPLELPPLLGPGWGHSEPHGLHSSWCGDLQPDAHFTLINGAASKSQGVMGLGN